MTTDKIYTTLKQIIQARPCGIERGSEQGYDKLRKADAGMSVTQAATAKEIRDRNTK